VDLEVVEEHLAALEDQAAVEEPFLEVLEVQEPFQLVLELFLNLQFLSYIYHSLFKHFLNQIYILKFTFKFHRRMQLQEFALVLIKSTYQMHPLPLTSNP